MTIDERFQANRSNQVQNHGADQEAAAELEAPPARPLLGDTTLNRWFFAALYDTNDWGELRPQPIYPSGPVPKTGPNAASGLAAQRLADPEARFHESVMLGAVTLLPLCVAHTAEERDRLRWEIGEILGLHEAVSKGWIRGFTLIWDKKRYPRMPTRLRIHPGSGRRTRSQVLGGLEAHIRQFAASLRGDEIT